MKHPAHAIVEPIGTPHRLIHAWIEHDDGTQQCMTLTEHEAADLIARLAYGLDPMDPKAVALATIDAQY
jgi:hypothetical protein